MRGRALRDSKRRRNTSWCTAFRSSSSRRTIFSPRKVWPVLASSTMWVPVRVVDPEHLAALAFQAGGARRRERAWQLIETGGVDRDQLRTLLLAHQIKADIDDER